MSCYSYDDDDDPGLTGATTEFVQQLWVGIPPQHVASYQLSQAIPLWVGAMSTGNGFSHHLGRYSKFCITVDPVTRTVGILI